MRHSPGESSRPGRPAPLPDWFRLDMGFPEHPKVLKISDRAFRFFVAAIAYSTRNLTDGLVDFPTVKHLGFTRKTALELEAVCLFDPAPEGWRIHDFLDYQPSRQDWKAVGEARREAGRLGGLAKARRQQEASKALAGASDLPPGNGASKRLANGYNVTKRNETLEAAPTAIAVAAAQPPPQDPVMAEGEAYVAREREFLAGLRLKLNPRAWDEDPDVEAKFRTFIAVHGLRAVESAVLECYRHRENGRTLSPWPGNVERFLPGEEVGRPGETPEEAQRRRYLSGSLARHVRSGTGR